MAITTIAITMMSTVLIPGKYLGPRVCKLRSTDDRPAEATWSGRRRDDGRRDRAAGLPRRNGDDAARPVRGGARKGRRRDRGEPRQGRRARTVERGRRGRGARAAGDGRLDRRPGGLRGRGR